ncbi:hypothetical protein [Streptomyces sp. NPDC001933]|uniref:hypothetical protein n=1 Tax=Streptomyces sp. NPDC001933 TaxID=3364626 RepID=UPI0036C74A5A
MLCIPCCSFDAGGDLTLSLELSPHLPDRVIAILRNDHKRWAHAVRVLEHTPQPVLPRGHCGSLTALNTQVQDSRLLDGLNELLDDCARLLPPGITGESHKDRDALPAAQFTVRIPAGGARCRRVTVHDDRGRQATSTFINLPDTWADSAYESPVTSAFPFIREAAEHALRASLARNRRAQGNVSTYLNTFGGFDAAFSNSNHAINAEWTVNPDDCGIELYLTAPHPKDSWRLLRLLEEWLGDHDMPDTEVTLEETRRSIHATLRGTAPVHFVAWHRAQRELLP